MYFFDNTYKNPTNIDVIDNKDIIIIWSLIPPSNVSTESPPSKIRITPDGNVVIKWWDTIPPQYKIERPMESKYDKQGNLLYLVKVLSPKLAYILELVSSNIYKIRLYPSSSIRQWTILITKPKLEKIIRI